MSFQIITDTCCDFPTPMYAQLDLVCVPLVVNFRGQTTELLQVLLLLYNPD